MLSTKIEKKIIKKLIKSTSDYKLVKGHDFYKMIIEPENEVTITLIDCWTIGGIPDVVIDFENDDDIGKLTINIESGKYHRRFEINVLGKDLVEGSLEDIDKCRINFRTNNKIGKLIVNQIICTEDLYSDYGNQDGYDPCKIYVTYNSKKYKDIKLCGNMEMETKKYECEHDGVTYSLSVLI